MAGKRILVIGGTGAQGAAVVKAMVQAEDPFIVRVLSRNPDSETVRKTFKDFPQVELVRGSFMDFEAVERALQDCYGVYVNTDGFSVNERDELWAGVRIFEIANTIPTLRHFVYSSIDYYLRLTNFDSRYAAHHTNGKGRVHTYLEGLPSPAHPASQLAWTVLVTGVYDEDLMGGPLQPDIEADGTRVFRLPLGDDGHLPLMTLRDCGALALAVFRDRAAWSGRTLRAVSHFATGAELAAALARVAGVPARYEDVPVANWVAALPYARAPAAAADPDGITAGDNYALWWPGFRDNVVLRLGERDFGELRRVHPGLQSLDDWLRETRWDGTAQPVLKALVDAGFTVPVQEPRI